MWIASESLPALVSSIGDQASPETGSSSLLARAIASLAFLWLVVLIAVIRVRRQREAAPSSRIRVGDRVRILYGLIGQVEAVDGLRVVVRVSLADGSQSASLSVYEPDVEVLTPASDAARQYVP